MDRWCYFAPFEYKRQLDLSSFRSLQPVKFGKEIATLLYEILRFFDPM